MKDFGSSETIKNLLAAVGAESVEAAKYSLYAGIAKKEGLGIISRLFESVANNEREHAEVWLRRLGSAIPKDTAAALEDAVKGENYAWSETYSRFARVADEEGFSEIGDLFREVAEIEKLHEEEFRSALKDVEDGSVYYKPRPVVWKCGHCGYEHYAEEAPEKCPVCGNPRSGFDVKCEV